MALPVGEKRDKRSKSVSFRISEKAATHLKALAKGHNLSQADVIEFLIEGEYERYIAKKK